MAKGRLCLAIYLALVLVMLPIATAWSVDPNTKNLTSRGGLRTDGAGDSGHPWDDGSSNLPPDSIIGRLTSVPLPPTVVPNVTSSGAKWISTGLVYLMQKMNFIKINGKARYTHQK